MKGREITERKVQGGEMMVEEDVLVESDARGESLRQPNRGVNPSRQESIQQIDTAIHVRLCEARALYLKMKTESWNERGLFLNINKKLCYHISKCIPHLSGMCNRRYRSTAMASSDSTEA